MGENGKNDCCKTVLKFTFSHIGLCVMVILYCVAGGFIFEHLEKNNEQLICYEAMDEYNPIENQTLDSLIKVVDQYPSRIDQWDNFRKILQRFRDNSIAIGYDGKVCSLYGETDGPVYRWSWAGSMMFSVTVITTIGYGHIAPKTFWGRLVCIAYAVLGIPLMLLCLANIGDVMADIFRFIYSRICCCGCCRKKPRPEQERVVQINPMAKEPCRSLEPGVDKVIKPVGTTSNDKALMKCAGDKTAVTGRASPLSRPVKIAPLDVTQYQGSSAAKKSARHTDSPIASGPLIVDDDSDCDDDDDDELDRVTVPLTVTMIVIAGYIFGGAVLFGLWEGWDWLQSAYFCFITLSTIGFGDVVPGTEFENPQAQAQLILGSVYLLFGMAILSMCFSLMQDEIIAKCRWVGRKLGILEIVE